MKKCIAILSTYKHKYWAKLTKESIVTFWGNHPEIKVFLYSSEKDWLTTALEMAMQLDADGYDMVYFFLSDHCLIGNVKEEFLTKTESNLISSDDYDAISYRSVNDNLVVGYIKELDKGNFCLFPSLWRTKALKKNLMCLDQLLLKEKRNVSHVDNLFHNGVLSRTAGISGRHETMPMPVHGCLCSGSVYIEYEKYYKRHPVLFNLFDIARKRWGKYGSVTLPNIVSSKYKRDIFFETGSYRGGGIETALDVGFDEIISVESEISLYDSLKTVFIDEIQEERVKLFLGKSVDILNGFKFGNKSVCFWLDAHGWVENTPLLEEILIILNKTKRLGNNIIMIDDVRLFGNPNGWGRNISVELIKNKVMSFDQNVEFVFEDSNLFKNDIMIIKSK